jgi:hypothetical protein
MKIHEYYYSEETRTLYIEFSTEEDSDKFYRTIELSYDDLEYYSPTIILEEDLLSLNKNFIIEFLFEYFKENDLPEETIL